MTERNKQFVFLCATQVLCVTIGLWLQHRFVTASLFDAADSQARLLLSHEADRLAASIIGEGASRSSFSNVDAGELRRKLETNNHTPRFPVALVDADWNVLNPVTDNSANGFQTGQTLSWDGLIERPNIEYTLGGFIENPNGGRIAIAVPLKHETGWLVVHTPAKPVRASAVVAADTLPLAGALAATWTCALLGITVFLLISRFHDRMDRERGNSETKSLRRIQTLVRTRDAVIFGLAKLADSRDPETGDHLERIAIYASTLASALRDHPRYNAVVTPTFIRLIGISSALHDIGKVGIEDSILRKPGKLTEEQRNRMQEHTIIGGECLRQIEYRLGQSNFLEMAREIALAHHERWDGKGYPYGLKGKEIPLTARIIAIADVYDALASKRVYKDAFPHSKCVEIIKQGSGTQFDADLVEIWLTIANQFRDLGKRYGATDLVVEPLSPAPENVEADEEEVAIF